MDENHQSSNTEDEFEFLDNIDFLAGINQEDEYDWINHIDFLANVDGIGENSIYSDIDFLANIDFADTDQETSKCIPDKNTLDQGKSKEYWRKRYSMKKVAMISAAAVVVLLAVRFLYANIIPDKEYSVMAKDENHKLTPEEQFNKELGYETPSVVPTAPTATSVVEATPDSLLNVQGTTKPTTKDPVEKPVKVPIQPTKTPAVNAITHPKEEEKKPNNIILQKPSKKGELKNTLFIGDSRTEGLKLSTGLKEPVFYCSKGLNVKSIFEQKVIRSKEKKKKRTVIEALSDRTYSKIYIMFGINELGWAYDSSFKMQYEKLVRIIKEKQPKAEIYIQSILPVNEEKVYKPDIYNNKKIENYNKLLQEVARETGCNYLDVASAVKSNDGTLPKEASTDGVHLDKEYCLKWIHYIKTHS